MMGTIFTSPEVDVSKKPEWTDSDVRSYRIELDITAPERPLQRHIWTLKDGTVDAEDWILSYSAKVPMHFRPCGHAEYTEEG